MKPLDPEPLQGETPEQKQPSSSLFQRIYRWRWGLFIFVLLCTGVIASFLWEKRIETKLGMHVTGETPGPSESFPPVVERRLPPKVNSEKDMTPSTSEPVLSSLISETALKEHLSKILDPWFQAREKIQQAQLKRMLNYHHQWMVFLMLRQEIAEGKPFDVVWRQFKQHTENAVQHLTLWKETESILDKVALKGVWPRWKLLQVLPQFALNSTPKGAETRGWLERLGHFFKNLFVFRKTNDKAQTASNDLETVHQLLRNGDLEAALVILDKLDLESTPGVQRWLEQAKTYEQLQMALDNLIQILETLVPEESFSK